MTNPYEGTEQPSSSGRFEGSPGAQTGVDTPSTSGTQPQISQGATQASSAETHENESEHRDTSSGIGEMSHQTAEQLRKAATEQAEQVRERADSARHDAVERIRRVGAVLRSAGGELRDQDETVAKYADKAGDRIDELADWVGSASVQSLVRDTQRFARERPAVFFGGAFVLGLVAGRFLRSSGNRAGHTEFGRDNP